MVAMPGSYIGHSLFVMWFECKVHILDNLYSSCGLNARFICWTLFTRHVVAIPGPYIGHSLLVLWFECKVHILDNLYSSCGLNARFIYWTLFTRHVV
jgi:hypothetical protein